jgi:hypothetical protein
LAAPGSSCSPAETRAGQQAPPAPSPPEQDPAPSPSPSDFARFVEVGKDEGRFETAITAYENQDGVRVSLVAAVHIADAAHYRELQKDFEGYDVLLYELVAEPDERPTPELKREGGVLGMLQVLLKTGLELEFQLHAIDYTPDNFVHADLTPAAFAAKMKERGESFLTIFFRLMSAEMQRQKKLAEERAAEEPEQEAAAPDLVAAFRRHEGRHTMRLMFARQLEEMEAIAAGAGPGEGTVLLEGRNERALEVLREQIEQGHRKIGIYYGGAHMPGIERALLEDMGFRKVGHRWLVAWDITKRLDPQRGQESKEKR